MEAEWRHCVLYIILTIIKQFTVCTRLYLQLKKIT